MCCIGGKGDYTKSRALIGSLSADITSTNKTAASCWRAFDEIKFFHAFSFRFWNNHLYIYTKTISTTRPKR